MAPKPNRLSKKVLQRASSISNLIEGALFLFIGTVMLDGKTEIKDWPEMYGRAISSDEYAEICNNINGFISLLKTWNDKEKTRLNDERNSGLRNTNNPGQA